MNIVYASNETGAGGFLGFIPLLLMFLLFYLIFLIFRNSLSGNRKKLKKISFEFLDKYLDNDEKILAKATGCSQTSFFEIIFTGFMIYEIKKSLFIFTNKRIFHIPTRKDYSYKNSIAHILYADCKSITIKSRKLIVFYKTGEKESYLLGRGYKKQLKELVQTISFEGTPSKTQKRIHICPRCEEELKKDKYTCPKCHLEFKNKDDARKISLIYPGGGYFYTRHPFLGIFDAIIEISLIVQIVINLADFINGVEGAGAWLCIFAAILVFEKIISVYHSNHFVEEYILKEKEKRTSAKLFIERTHKRKNSL
jgi:hypothetical protein